MQTSGWADVTAYRAGALGFEVMQLMAGVPRTKKRSADETGAATGKKTELAAVDGMSVAALRSALSARSLSTSGIKEQLVERLKAAIPSGGGSSSSAIAVDH